MVEYPPELKLFYVFVERLLDIKSSTKSWTIIDLMRRLKYIESRRNVSAESDSDESWTISCVFVD